MVAAAYGGAAPVFGPDYIIPKPFDPRLILEIAPAVARAAMDSGVARRPLHDLAHYQRDLERFVFRSRQPGAGVRGRTPIAAPHRSTARVRMNASCVPRRRWLMRVWPAPSCLAAER